MYNFYPGPATLPKEILEKAQSDFFDYHETGMSVMEMSHRSKPVEDLIATGEALIKELLGIGDEYRVLFLQGGASQQFFMIPMNFLPSGQAASYILTGNWSEKASKEADVIGNMHVAASSKNDEYRYIPDKARIKLKENPAYVHLTSNNTIYGTQWHEFPDVDAPLIADMSSDIMSRPIDANKFSLIYAGSQKNLGPAGVTIVIVEKEFLNQKANPPKHAMLNYATFMEKNSLYNTPPVYAIYMMTLVLEWIKDQGGLAKLGERNQEKANYIYNVIDDSDGFYRGHAETGSRSLMNITFNLHNSDLEDKFLQQAEAEGLIGLKGHRSVGGLRVSLYNGMTVEGAKVLAEFMKDFQHKNE